MASVFKRSSDRGKKGTPWYMRFKDADRRWHTQKGCTDKAGTEQMAHRLEDDAALQRADLTDPKTEGYAGSERRPLSEHLDDFHARSSAKGNTAKHAKLFTDRAGRIIQIAGATRLSHLTPSRIQEALASLKTNGRSSATCNHHRAAIRGFARWAWHDGRLRDDPLVKVAGYNAKEDPQHDRRTIGLDDLLRLIDAAQVGPAYRRITGPDRAMCYRLAATTGLRCAEIQIITPESFALDGASRP